MLGQQGSQLSTWRSLPNKPTYGAVKHAGTWSPWVGVFYTAAWKYECINIQRNIHRRLCLRYPLFLISVVCVVRKGRERASESREKLHIPNVADSPPRFAALKFPSSCCVSPRSLKVLNKVCVCVCVFWRKIPTKTTKTLLSIIVLTVQSSNSKELLQVMCVKWVRAG